jgi:hypothetical protein
MHSDGQSYRLIGRNVGLSKNTVMEIGIPTKMRSSDREPSRRKIWRDAGRFTRHKLHAPAHVASRARVGVD